MEVNMAVFVMAIGILGMVALYPLGLRESTQGQADLKQSMFADYVLNQAVAAAAQTNITWSQWSSVPKVGGTSVNLDSSVPGFIKNNLDMTAYPDMQENKHYRIACCRIAGASDKIMGIMVQSTDLTKSITKYEQVTNNPVYYAEVLFQGDPTK
jgi:hypothetical protein